MHPNICQFLGAHLQADSCYLVLELMKCDLFSALSNPDWTQILSWGERCGKQHAARDMAPS